MLTIEASLNKLQRILMTDDYKELIVGQTSLQAEMKYLTEDIRELVKCVKSLELREPGHKEIEHRLRRLEVRENALRKDLEIYLFLSKHPRIVALTAIGLYAIVAVDGWEWLIAKLM